MKISIYIVLLFVVLLSCQQEKQKKLETQSSVSENSPVEKIKVEKKDTLNEFHIEVEDKKRIDLPFGSKKVKAAKPVTDTIYKVYKEVQTAIQLAIDDLTFKKTDNFKNFEILIKKTNDSLNRYFTVPFFYGLKDRLFYLSIEYIEKEKIKFFFLKTIYYNPINKKNIENIYLISTVNNKVIDVFNIYYNYKQSFGFGSRFFFIDIDYTIYSALYDNIEGDVSIKSPTKYHINDKGGFESY